MHTQAYKHEPPKRNHETPKARKVQEGGDKVKEKHGMKPQLRPTHTTCTRSHYGG